MPISFSVASHPAKSVSLTAQEISGLTPEVLLSRACVYQSRLAGEILQFSVRDEPAEPPVGPRASLNRRLSKLNPFSKAKAPPAPSSSLSSVLIPTPNGFVNTIISAYNRHHNLIIRPDDVWITILTQFNFFVNANAERLRASFVAHEGKQTLTVRRQGLDFAAMARQMTDLLATVVVDPTLRAWVMPDFSTTSVKDTTVGAIVMMSMLKSYFEYVFEGIECGIPRVTLDGTKADWEGILRRLEKLKEYGIETTAWYHLLVPVISRFVTAFDAPDAASNVEFWQQVAHFVRGGSGPSYYSGWITAFCVFNEEGKWIGLPLNQDVPVSPEPPESLSAKEFWMRYGSYPSRLTLDDTPFHKVDSNNIPSSYIDVPVVVKNSPGAEPEPCTMIAGVIGTLATVTSANMDKDGKSDDGNLNTDKHETARDTVQPVTGWWMFRNK
ncbi:hypothetical protein C8R45DRAFT_1019076 [Mycena sanguinolenta]|nr:hypothetical protein C8R45DRAFT_1019076 [Mycena sanguinolenta]